MKGICIWNRCKLDDMEIWYGCLFDKDEVLINGWMVVLLINFNFIKVV